MTRLEIAIKAAVDAGDLLMDNYGKIKPVEEVLAIKPTEYPKKALKPEIRPQNNNVQPPIGLTGIDLAIWKSENWK